MTLMSAWQKFNVKMFDKYTADSGKMLIHMGALGWVFSSIAQIGVVAGDKKISKKDKKFLVPQEICDAVTNVGLYYTVSKAIKSYGDSLVGKGTFLLDDAEKVIGLLKNEAVSSKEAIKGLYESLDSSLKNIKTEYKSNRLGAILDKYYLTNGYATMNPAQQKQFDALVKSVKEKVADFKGGLGVVTSILASILASNLLTPIVRNKMAGLYQQKFLMKHDESERAKSYAPQPLPAAFRTFNVSSGLKI